MHRVLNVSNKLSQDMTRQDNEFSWLAPDGVERCPLCDCRAGQVSCQVSHISSLEPGKRVLETEEHCGGIYVWRDPKSIVILVIGEIVIVRRKERVLWTVNRRQRGQKAQRLRKTVEKAIGDPDAFFMQGL